MEQKNNTLLEMGVYDDGPYEVGDEHLLNPDLVPLPANSYLGQWAPADRFGLDDRDGRLHLLSVLDARLQRNNGDDALCCYCTMFVHQYIQFGKVKQGLCCSVLVTPAGCSAQLH